MSHAAPLPHFVLPGFTLLTPEMIGIRPRLICGVEALEKQGKTHFAMTAPDPIALLNFDKGQEGVIDKFVKKGKRIYHKIYNFDPTKGQDPATEAWNSFRSDYYGCLRSGIIRTVVVDTSTAAWACIRLARFGKLEQVRSRNYGPVNAEMDSVIRDAYDFNCNVIWLHKRRDQYVNDTRTGQLERDAYKDMGFAVQVNLLAWREANGLFLNGPFHVTVLDSRQNATLAGMDFQGGMETFPTIASFVLPDVPQEYWR